MYNIFSVYTKNRVFCFFVIFLNHFWTSFDAILQDVSAAETIVLWWTINFRLLSFSVPKIMIVGHE